MSKQDYEWLALLLRKHKPSPPNPDHDMSFYMYQAGEWEKWSEIVIHLTNTLEQKEPKFKPAKFMLACGLEAPHE